jgi:hypothetical protein
VDYDCGGKVSDSRPPTTTDDDRNERRFGARRLPRHWSRLSVDPFGQFAADPGNGLFPAFLSGDPTSRLLLSA